MTPSTLSFAVYPAGGSFVHPAPDECTFDAFVLDVPNLSGEDATARRAWWSAFHWLGRQGIDVDEFTVYELLADGDGRQVGSGGFTLDQEGTS